MPLQLLSRPTDATRPHSSSTLTTPALMHSIPTIHLVAANPGPANSIKFGNERMIRVKHDGLLERQNLENTVLTGDREENVVSRLACNAHVCLAHQGTSPYTCLHSSFLGNDDNDDDDDEDEYTDLYSYW